ncbi:hypothetical protein [Bradyrhizobium sp. B117]|uniref:hypothetical protein n=1 Tax=Bradyrhizobium sp. B117 TaxID=3140246 RepID=UPI003183EEAC
MPQLIEFEGRRHEFPDDFTQADIQRALSSMASAPRLPEVGASERRYRMANGSGTVSDPKPIQVQGPDGAIVEFPAGTSNEDMTVALQKHYGAPGQTIPALPPGYTLDQPAAVPPLPSGNMLDRARSARKATEAEVDRSVVGTLIREDPRDAASSILADKYGGPKKLDEINALVRNDAQAMRGWKAAMSEVLADKVQGTRRVGETLEVQFARLAKEFKDNETLLAKTFSPEEMNNLRQAHKILSYFKEAEKRATVGSDTAEKIGIPTGVQLAFRHIYGDLKGGGVIKRMKLLLEMLPSGRQNVDEIVNAAWFDPNLAAYLLERPVKNYNVPRYNLDLRRLIAAANASRDQ